MNRKPTRKFERIAMTANRRGRKVGPVALLFALFVIAVVAQAAPAQPAGGYRWYKGYVRASIRSTKPLANPGRLPPGLQEAYTQPVGWEKPL
jgi:hypothetical protein